MEHFYYQSWVPKFYISFRRLEYLYVFFCFLFFIICSFFYFLAVIFFVFAADDEGSHTPDLCKGVFLVSSRVRRFKLRLKSWNICFYLHDIVLEYEMWFLLSSFKKIIIFLYRRCCRFIAKLSSLGLWRPYIIKCTYEVRYTHQTNKPK